MDLGAYSQIENLDKVVKDNGIEVPRLRGYRLMKDEEPVQISDVVDKRDVAVSCVEGLCESLPFWRSKTLCHELSPRTDRLKSYYLVSGKDEDGYTEYTDVRWDRIHGWKRKVLKTCIHNEMKRQTKQWEIWNKYVGRDDILYIHARIGGNNWPYYSDMVANEPWFIEKIDDSFDSTYCDIFAKIKPVQTESEV